MRKLLMTGFGLILAVAVAVNAVAATAPKPTHKPVVHSISGTIESYDVTAHTLVVKGSRSNWTFDAAAAKAWKGTKSVALDDLKAAAGSHATVKYTQKDGHNLATTVRVVVPTAAKAK